LRHPEELNQVISSFTFRSTLKQKYRQILSKIKKCFERIHEVHFSKTF